MQNILHVKNIKTPQNMTLIELIYHFYNKKNRKTLKKKRMSHTYQSVNDKKN